MKVLLFLCLSLLLNSNITAQTNNKYIIYTNRVKQFSKPAKVLYDHIDASGNGSIEFTNAKKQILRFRVNNQKLQIQHGGISFQLFSYGKKYLQKLETFDINGNLAGERVSKNEAIIVFTIEKPETYLKKKKLIDDAEGNINIKDDTNEKIIKIKLYDDKNQPIVDVKPLYISSKMFWDYNVRMYWP